MPRRDALAAMIAALPGPRGRLFGQEAMAEAERTIAGWAADAGWEVERRPYRAADVIRTWQGREPGRIWEQVEGANLVAERRGALHPDQVVVVMAHYDTVATTVGANDNTASVAAAVEVGRALAGHVLDRTVMLAFTDGEETGLLGSTQLAADLADREVVLVVNYDAMAYTDPTEGSQDIPELPDPGAMAQLAEIEAAGRKGEFSMILHNGPATAASHAIAAGLRRRRGPLACVEVAATEEEIAAAQVGRDALLRSDHVPFWRQGVAALHIADTAEFRSPHYHRWTDTPETVDLDCLEAIIDATIPVVQEAASIRSVA
jgi:Zn-dependent M28 family amino/carboxypeptidase